MGAGFYTAEAVAPGVRVPYRPIRTGAGLHGQAPVREVDTADGGLRVAGQRLDATKALSEDVCPPESLVLVHRHVEGSAD